MNNYCKRILLILSILCLSFSVFCDENIHTSEIKIISEKNISYLEKIYELSFYDDFEGNDINLANWSRCREEKRQNLGGWWKDECSYVKDGCLIIESKQNSDGLLISGGINTKNKFMQNKGIYEIRFKITEADALWYAFWINTPGMFKHHEKQGLAEEGAEIDMFEIRPGKKVVNTAIHYGGYEYYNNNLHTKSKELSLKDDFYNNFHTFIFCWTDKSYDCYLDGKRIYRFEVAKCGGECKDKGYLVISSEYGTFGGNLPEIVKPSYMIVDYIKVYKEIELEQ